MIDFGIIGRGLLGIAAFLLIAFLLSENRRLVRPRVIFSGLALQAGLALLLVNVPPVRALFALLTDAVRALAAATQAGTAYVFGYLGGGALPFETGPGANTFLLAFSALPLVVVISALAALLWHWRILVYFVRGFSWLMRKTFGVGGAVGVSAAANIFIGMAEAPLLIRPYLKSLSRSELAIVMSCGMATIAGTMMVFYGELLKDVIDNAFAHLLTASIINAPAAIMIAMMMVPETRDAAATADHVDVPRQDRNALDALVRGGVEGIRLLISIIAMIIVFVAMIWLINAVLTLFPDVAGAPLTLQRIFGAVLAPFVWLTGISAQDIEVAGGLLGTKLIINELIAYLDMVALAPDALSERSKLIMTYVLCSFGNVTGLSIMLGSLTAAAPERRREIMGLGIKAVAAGLLATSLTGTLLGMIMS